MGHSSECERSFSHWDFDLENLPNCPVKGCTTTPNTVPYRQRELPYCMTHGLRLHGVEGRDPRFVYDNGPTKNDKIRARLRNFLFEPEFVREHVLDNPGKAETHRLGHESSEDALSWNVFAGLLQDGLLSKAMSWLAGRKIDGEPDLYMWGCRIGLKENTHELYAPLIAARRALEARVKSYLTEPDIMLVVRDKFVMCIEAKFTSGNSLAHTDGQREKNGEKPKSVEALKERYFTWNSFWKDGSKYIDPDYIGQPFHGQLFRNIVFATGMAETFGGDWQVVNLVSSTQWRMRGKPKAAYEDPTEAIRRYLTSENKARFTFRTWEALYQHIVAGDPQLQKLARYLEGKSACLNPAFEL